MNRKTLLGYLLVAFVVLVTVQIMPDAGVLLAAAVTTVKSSRNVGGARKYREFIITGDNTNTLDTGARCAAADLIVTVEPCTITAIAKSIVNGQVRITFTASGAFTAISVVCSSRN